MPWSDPGGSGKQNGKQSPWGQRPGASGTSWSIEKITKELRKLGSKLANGSAPQRGKELGRWLPLIVLVILFAAWLSSGFYQLGPGQEGVLLRFGQIVATVPPGSHYHWPYPIEQVEAVDVGRNRRLVLGYGGSDDTLNPGRLLTTNGEVVDIRYAGDYRIANPQEYLFANANPQQYLAYILTTAVRKVTQGMSSDQLLSAPHDVLEQEILKAAQQLMENSHSGLQLQGVQVIEITHPNTLDKEYQAIEQARKAAQAEADKVKAEGQKSLLAAKAAADKMRSQAQVEAEQILGKAKGDSARFDAAYRAYQTDPQVMGTEMYLQALQDAWRKAGRVVFGGNDTIVQVPAAVPDRSAEAPQASATATALSTGGKS